MAGKWDYLLIISGFDWYMAMGVTSAGSGSARLSLIFSAIGHAYIHMFTAFYFTIVLAIELDWEQPFHELLSLWTPAALLVGLVALPAGWLADRWSVIGTMVVYFLGLGAAAMVAGLMAAPLNLLLAMAGIGVFAAIYHPVGIPWVIRNAAPERIGKMLAINGVFGSVGVGLAAIVAGALIDLWGWRAAFIVPGALCFLTGLAMLVLVRTGHIVEAGALPNRSRRASKGDRVRVLMILFVTMLIGGIVFNGVQSAMPKLFAVRLIDLTGGSAAVLGGLVGAVYIGAGLAQLIGGYLADRVQLRYVLLGAWVLQAPLLAAMAVVLDAPLLLVAFVAVSANSSALAAENMLLSRSTPQKHQSLAFGLKFVIAFGAAPLAIQLVATVQAATGALDNLYLIFGIGTGLVALLVAALPSERDRSPVVEPVAAE